MDSNNVIDGYLFNSAADYERAKKEYTNILKIKKKINPDNIDEMYNLYLKLVGKKIFVTPVGLGFLHEMREYLAEKRGEEELPPISVPEEKVVKLSGNDGIYRDKYNKMCDERDKLLNTKKKLSIAVTALVFLVIGMIFIVVTNDNLGYFNAEEKVLDKYATWQEQLENWEKELIEREDALEMRENSY